MSQINLRRELADEKRETVRQMEKGSTIQEQKLLMAYDDSVDQQVLRNIGLDHGIKATEELKGKSITLNNLEKEYEGEIFSKDMLRTIASRYDLKLRPTSSYKGVVDGMAAMHIKTFMDKKNLSYSTRGYADQFFILAPVKVFKSKTVTDMTNLNPMLFYRVDNDHYRLIYKWGNDFNDMQYVKAYPFRNANTFSWSIAFFTFWLVSFLLIAVSPTSTMISSYLCSAVIASLVGFIFNRIIKANPDDFDMISERGWTRAA